MDYDGFISTVQEKAPVPGEEAERVAWSAPGVQWVENRIEVSS